MAGHDDKAKRYIASLDTARVNGDWDEIPELIRKVTKHAPKRTILIQTATAEHGIATRKSTLSDAQEPLKTLIALVTDASNAPDEDDFQARSCLAWAHGLVGASLKSGQYGISSLAEFDRYGQKSTSSWTKICLIRSAFFSCMQASRTDQSAARTATEVASKWIEQNQGLVESLPQLSYWSQQLLAQTAFISEDAAADPEVTAKAYRQWLNTVGKRGQDIPAQRYGNGAEHVTRSQVWRCYYKFASHSLRSGHFGDSGPSRAEKATELRLVESAYESYLLANKKFPHATETNTEVEQWVESVIANWQVLSGPDFEDKDLGQGGRNALTRNVLDILYRAASKTFHSTLILRRLFQVHKALAEFDLAYHCLDTYIELADSGRARSAKSQQPDPNQDSDEIIMLTLAEGIEGLCAFGRQAEAQKAHGLALKLESWMETTPEILSVADSGTMQTINRAIGIAKAQWARWTPVNESRTDLQTEALEALRSACSTSQPHPASVYALALLLAETRDIQQAIKWTKLALQEGFFSSGHTAPTGTMFWHLLALLLSSKQDFETSMQSCAAAAQDLHRAGFFRQTQRPNSTVSSLEKGDLNLRGGDNDMECGELQKIIELELSHLALVELLEGPEAALNNSNELLSLYSVLFSRFDVGSLQPRASASKTLEPPKSSAGTIKSFRGSLFSRKREITSSTLGGSAAKRETPRKLVSTSRPPTQASQAPAIQVTDESEKTHKHHLFHHSHDQPNRKGEVSGHQEGELAARQATNGTTDNELADGGAKQPLKEVPHDMTPSRSLPPPLKNEEQPPHQDNRLPNVNVRTTSTAPTSRFSKAVAEKHALIILAKVWLVIATLYRRAHMFEDAKESCEEAAKIASKVEALVLAQDTSAKALCEAGWGGAGKSADDVWADVHHERAELILTVARRHEEEGKELSSQSLREAVAEFEQCLMYAPNHSNGVVGLSGLLLDYYERKIELGKQVEDGRLAQIALPSSPESRPAVVRSFTGLSQHSQKSEVSAENTSDTEDLRKTPDNLNRIAARDRAYSLLSILTKTGSDWDNSEAWCALARAHELGGEVEKAKNILWWCVELEDSRPIRHWRNLSRTGYVL